MTTFWKNQWTITNICTHNQPSTLAILTLIQSPTFPPLIHLSILIHLNPSLLPLHLTPPHTTLPPLPASGESYLIRKIFHNQHLSFNASSFSCPTPFLRNASSFNPPPPTHPFTFYTPFNLPFSSPPSPLPQTTFQPASSNHLPTHLPTHFLKPPPNPLTQTTQLTHPPNPPSNPPPNPLTHSTPLNPSFNPPQTPQ